MPPVCCGDRSPGLRARNLRMSSGRAPVGGVPSQCGPGSTGSNAAEVADAFGEIAETARILADAVETEERRQPDPAAISLRARGVA